MKSSEQFIKEAMEELDFQLVETLKRLGDECVKRTRNRTKAESWTDRTGNLRSSVGMAVYKNGETLTKSTFEKVEAPEGDGSEGSHTGSELVEKLASKFIGEGHYGLSVVAAMDYASFVEAKGYDVLSGTATWASKEAQKQIDLAVKRASKNIDNLKL